MEYVIERKCEKCAKTVEAKRYNLHGCNYCHYMPETALNYNEIKKMESLIKKGLK